MIAARPAQVLSRRGSAVRIECPYCGNAHLHRNVTPGVVEHRAAGCEVGTPIPSAWRAAGYTFEVQGGDR